MAHNTIDVPQLVRAERRERVRDRSMEKRTLYVPPLDGSLDPHREFDQWVSRQIEGMLQRHFPGYPWKAECRAEQGLVYFNVPILMGETLHWAIKLGQWQDMSEPLVVAGGGELLERMNLPRTGFEVMSFLEARDNKHKLDFADVGRKRII